MPCGRFVNLANERYDNIISDHKVMLEVMKMITLENSLADKLKKDLDHERVVLEERKMVKASDLFLEHTIVFYPHRV